MQRDLEGGVADTRRGVTCELVNAMCVHFELVTAQMCLAQCEALLARSDWQVTAVLPAVTLLGSYLSTLHLFASILDRLSSNEHSRFLFFPGKEIHDSLCANSRKTKEFISSLPWPSNPKPRCLHLSKGDFEKFCLFPYYFERQSGGVIETNPHVDVIQFFQRHVLTDLQVYPWISVTRIVSLLWNSEVLMFS
jgi:hypothetical protein